MAATDTSVWTTLIPVFGALGGTVLGSWLGSSGAQRRDRTERAERLRDKQRESVIDVIRAGKAWAGVATPAIGAAIALNNRSRWESSKAYSDISSAREILARILTEARILMSDKSIGATLFQLDKELLAFTGSLHDLQQVESDAKTIDEATLQEMEEFLACRRSLRTVAIHIATVEAEAPEYFQSPLINRSWYHRRARRVSVEKP